MMPVHDADCEATGLVQPIYCACSYRASLVALEREREEDWQAIRDYHRVFGQYWGFEKVADHLAKKHAAAIARAQRP